MKETLLAALNSGGQELLRHLNKPAGIKVKESQSSIVTDADLSSNSIILDLICRAYPHHNIISEESGYEYKNSNYTWVVDPLDGTSNFASSLPWFGVLIALFDGNRPIMGGAYLPVSDVLYFAEKGKGTFKNGKPLVILDNKELVKSLVTFSVDYTDDEIFLNRCLSIYKAVVKGARNIRCTNSLVDFVYVAEGKFGGCINLFTRLWDIAALGLIISEAGGEMVDLNGMEIEYLLENKVVEKNFSVIAGTKEIVQSLTRIVREAQ